MKMNKIIFISGGARSGKSTFAEKLSLYIYNKNKNNKKIAYIATSERVDEEFVERIKIHRENRAKEFITYEESISLDNLIKTIYGNHDIFLIECLTTWLGNIFYKFGENDADKEAKKIIGNIFDFLNINEKKEFYDDKYFYNLLRGRNKIKKVKFDEYDKVFIFVSNEVGLGIVPDNTASRRFRDTQGFINQRFFRISYLSYFLINGYPLILK